MSQCWMWGEHCRHKVGRKALADGGHVLQRREGMRWVLMRELHTQALTWVPEHELRWYPAEPTPEPDAKGGVA